MSMRLRVGGDGKLNWWGLECSRVLARPRADVDMSESLAEGLQYPDTGDDVLRYWILLHHGYARIYLGVLRYPTLSASAKTIKCRLDVGGNLAYHTRNTLHRVSIRYVYSLLSEG